MKIFQFYFYPRFKIFKPKKQIVFESFCYRPGKKEEEDLNLLCILLEAEKYALKELRSLVEKIKDEYYSFPQRGIESSFKSSLEKIDVIPKGLKQMLIFAVDKNFSCLFSKVGEFKLILYREGQMFNIGDNSIGRTFSDLTRGELSKGDRLFISNKYLFDQLWDNNFYKDFRKAKTIKEIKKVFKRRKKEIKGFEGVLIFIKLDGKWKKIYFNFPKLKFPKISFFNKILPSSPFLRERIKKGIISLIILILFLFLGYLIF